MPRRALPYKQPETIIKKMRRFAANKNPKIRFKDHINDLSDKHLLQVYQLLESGTPIKQLEKIIKNEWGELPNSGEIWKQISWILQQMLRDENTGVQKTQARVNALKKEETALKTGIEKLETEIVKRFNPLDELAWLANLQHKRIQQFRTSEESAANDSCGPDGDMRPKVNREIDSMIERQRLLVSEFVRSLKELRDLSGEPSQKDKRPRSLNSVHVHLQGAVEHPKEMITLIETYADDLDALAVPVSEVKAIEAK